MMALARSRLLVGVALLIVLGKVTGLLRDLLIGATFGVSATTDAYFFASAVTAVLHVGIAGAIPLVVVPRLVGYASTQSPPSPRGMVAVILAGSLILALVLLMASAVDARFASGLDPAARGLLRGYLALMATTFVLTSYIGIANAIQVWRGRTTWAYATPVFNNVVFCAALVVGGAAAGLAPVLVVAILGLVLLALLNRRELRADADLAVPVRPSSQEWRATIALLSPVAATLYVEQGYSFIATFAASHIPGHAVTQWSLASRLAFPAVSVFGVLIATSVFPRMANAVASGDWSALRDTALVTCRRILLVCTPAVLLGFMYATSAIAELVQLGRISAADARSIAKVLALLLLGLPLALMRELFSRGVIAIGRADVVLRISLTSALLLAALAFGAVQWAGLPGLAVAFVVTQLAQACAFIRSFQRFTAMHISAALILLASRALVVALVVAGIRLVLQRSLALPWMLEAFLCFAAYLMLAAFLGDPDLRALKGAGTLLVSHRTK